MKPIQVDFKPSAFVSALLALMSVGAFCIVMLMPFAWQIKLLLGLLIAVSASYAVFLHGLRLLPWSIVALNINSKNQLKLAQKNGEFFEVLVKVNTVVTPYLTVLNCQLKEATFLQRLSPQHIIIVPDAVNAEDYRQLCVWLRWAKVLENNELD